MAAKNQDIDPDTGYEVGRAQRPGIPFPDERIPTQTTSLEGPDGKRAFDDDVRPRSEDGTIENLVGEVTVPVTPQSAAAALAVKGVKITDSTGSDEKHSGIDRNDPSGLSNPTDTVATDKGMVTNVNTPVGDSRPHLAPSVAPTSAKSDESDISVDSPTDTVTDDAAKDPEPATKLDVRDDAPTENVPVEESTAKASSPEKAAPKKTATRRVRQ